MINGATKLLCLIGSPVEHSMSPKMHNRSCEVLGLDYAYMAFDIKEHQVQEFLDAARLLNIRGFNVTMPCKMEAARLVDELSPAGKIMQATNAVVNENGKFIGFSDGIADSDYDEIKYLAEAHKITRLTSQMGSVSVASDEQSLRLSANINESAPLME
jgi:hypothetical protein